MIGFNEIAAAMVPDAKGFRAEIPESWRQGRTAYGGLTAGLSLIAAQKQFPDLPPFRSVTVNFIGPVSGDPVFTSRLLRQGRNSKPKARWTARSSRIVFLSLAVCASRLSRKICLRPKPPRPKLVSFSRPRALEILCPLFSIALTRA